MLLMVILSNPIVCWSLAPFTVYSRLISNAINGIESLVCMCSGFFLDQALGHWNLLGYHWTLVRSNEH